MCHHFEHSKHIEMWNHIIEIINEYATSEEGLQSLRELKPLIVYELKRKALKRMNINENIKNLCFGCSYALKEKFIEDYDDSDDINCKYCPFYIDDKKYIINCIKNENSCLNGLYEKFCDSIEPFLLDTEPEYIEDTKKIVIDMALKIRDCPVKEDVPRK